MTNLHYYRRSPHGPIQIGQATSYEAGVAAVRNTDLALHVDGLWLHRGTWHYDCPVGVKVPPPAPISRDNTRYIYHEERAGKKKVRLVIPHLGIKKLFGTVDEAQDYRDRALNAQTGAGWGFDLL